MEKNKKSLGEKMYRKIDIACNGEFDFEKDYDLFIQVFENVLCDYALVPKANIID
jgi:hypothetical protein